MSQTVWQILILPPGRVENVTVEQSKRLYAPLLTVDNGAERKNSR